MKINAPLGIDWRPFHSERVFNAVENILKGSPLFKFGLTSWDNYYSLKEQILSGESINAYLLNANEYIIYALIALISGTKSLVTFGPFLDQITIFLTALISSELIIYIFKNISSINPTLKGISIFTIFITSPWTYRITIAPAHHLQFLFLYLFSIYLFTKSKKNLGIFVYFLSANWQFHWTFLISFFYISIFIVGKLSKDFGKINNLFPPEFRDTKSKLLLIFTGISPVFINFIQFIAIFNSSLNINSKNSGILFRIGIDNVENIHHGGLLAAFQFLGGNRISLCLNESIFSFGNNLFDKNIFIFNCILAITGMTILSLFSILGYFNNISFLVESRWITMPLFFAFFIFASIFQQSWAVHLQGYSIIFSFIFSAGIFGCLNLIIEKLKLNFISNIFILPFTLALAINGIRVSYFTGING